MEEIDIKEQKQKKPSFFKRELSHKTKVTLAILLVVFGLLFALGIYLYPFDFSKNNANKAEEENANDTACPLNGVYVTKEAAERRPFGVMVENSSDARPQSGINKADLVYEGVTEGGITRFLAFYQCQDVSEIGPVRSARDYFIDWIEELSAFYAHCGGSEEALARIQEDKILDLNQFAFGNYYWRSNSRYAPHNLYTSYKLLKEAAQSKNYDLKSASFKSWSFKDDIKLEERPEAFSFKVNFSGPAYHTSYDYNKATNDWTRKIAGIVDKDSKTGEPIQVKNVVVQFAQMTMNSKDSAEFQNVGTGTAMFFIDGKITEGKWQKDSLSSRTKYTDSTGKEIKFNRGQIWVEVVNIGSKVEY